MWESGDLVIFGYIRVLLKLSVLDNRSCDHIASLKYSCGQMSYRHCSCLWLITWELLLSGLVY